jgi:hypothetical protein
MLCMNEQIWILESVLGYELSPLANSNEVVHATSIEDDSYLTPLASGIFLLYSWKWGGPLRVFFQFSWFLLVGFVGFPGFLFYGFFAVFLRIFCFFVCFYLFKILKIPVIIFKCEQIWIWTNFEYNRFKFEQIWDFELILNFKRFDFELFLKFE